MIRSFLRALTRLWRRRRYPTPDDFDRMSAEEFNEYLARIGFDVHIAQAQAEAARDHDQPARDTYVDGLAEEVRRG